jgi:hypothetical protein
VVLHRGTVAQLHQVSRNKISECDAAWKGHLLRQALLHTDSDGTYWR